MRARSAAACSPSSSTPPSMPAARSEPWASRAEVSVRRTLSRSISVSRVRGTSGWAPPAKSTMPTRSPANRSVRSRILRRARSMREGEMSSAFMDRLTSRTTTMSSPSRLISCQRKPQRGRARAKAMRPTAKVQSRARLRWMLPARWLARSPTRGPRRAMARLRRRRAQTQSKASTGRAQSKCNSSGEARFMAASETGSRPAGPAASAGPGPTRPRLRSALRCGHIP